MKKKKYPTVPFHQYIISLICVGFLAGGGAYIYLDHVVKTQYTKTNISQSTDDLKPVHDLYEEIISNYVGDVDQQTLIDGALKGMTSSLDDPYSSYLTGSEAQNLEENLSGSFEGIGATMSLENGRPTIAQAPVEGSPAAKAGLRIDDVVLAVDDVPTEGQSLQEVVSKIRGKKGTEVKLNIQRGDESFSVTIVRDQIPVDSISFEVDKEDPAVGLIRISIFSETSFIELQRAVVSLREEGAKSFVIDLRQNPGGLLTQVERMVSMFLDDGEVIVQFEDKKGNVQKDVAGKALDNGFKVKEPVAVLIDGGSASASEIFAAALQESRKVSVFGTTSFGKGTVQTVKDLNDDSEVKLTILKWLTPEGEWIHEKGVTPTVEADYPDYAYLAPISRHEPLKLGDSSSAVKNLNTMLTALSYEVDSNEEYSEKTEQAVKTIQTDHDLEATGIVDGKTAEKIEAALTELIQENDTAYEKAKEYLLDQK